MMFFETFVIGLRGDFCGILFAESYGSFGVRVERLGFRV